MADLANAQQEKKLASKKLNQKIKKYKVCANRFARIKAELNQARSDWAEADRVLANLDGRKQRLDASRSKAYMSEYESRKEQINQEASKAKKLARHLAQMSQDELAETMNLFQTKLEEAHKRSGEISPEAER